MTQLYGLFDPYTHEWSDGVLGGTFREMATAKTQERQVCMLFVIEQIMFLVTLITDIKYHNMFL